MAYLKNTLHIVVFCLSVLFVVNETIEAMENEDFHLSGDSVTWGFTHAGYSDGWYWGRSSDDYHPFSGNYYGGHEMLCGEFATAIWWNDCGKDEAIWLTNWFECPSFPTGTIFESYGTPPYLPWDDPNNPVDNPDYPNRDFDTAYAILRDTVYDPNGSIEVRMDYEVVDLAFGDPNNTARSPLSFIVDDTVQYIASERHILLVTYTIKNTTDSNTIAGLEFYQMLHGHPADQYGAIVNSTYNTVAYSDPLENYVPYNSVHKASGSNYASNFRYDITQWNNPASQYDTHIDYMSFSSTIEPDVIDNDVFEGHSNYEPTTGTYANIIDRNLNGETAISASQAAGAMGWYLPDLGPGESTSITIAVMFGYGEPSDSGLWVEKTDNIDPNGLSCVDPTSEDPNDYKITYTIEYGNGGSETVDNCVLTDYLPAEVLYPIEYTFEGGFPVSSDPNYDEGTRIYTWNIGSLEPNETGSVTLTVYATTDAEPGGNDENGDGIKNEVILSSAMGWVKDTWITPVCCYEEEATVYVDAYATGAETGTNWENAYTDLQDALDRIRTCGATEIWVARGIYKPDRGTASQTEAFTLVNETPVYGGFNGTETSREQRDFIKNQTILSGDIDTDGDYDSNRIVLIEDCNSVTLDGFIITDGLKGIYTEDSGGVITNCIVADNAGDGITGINSNMEISWSIIKNNIGTGADGIDIQGNTSTPEILNCKIRDNEAHGINALYSYPTIKNSWIHHNDCGIYLNTPSSVATIQGNTICDNYAEGIKRTGGTAPTVSNCILWDNDMSGNETQIAAPDMPTYSCIYDPNTASSTPDEIYHNITADPMFAYSDPNFNNFHINPDSPCEDKGASGSYTGEKDIDNEDRLYGNTVDMGADEITCDEVYNELDWTKNEVVNMEEFSIFSAAWLTHDPNEPDGDPNFAVGWNPICNIDESGDSQYVIDLADFEIFCENWLWQPCYRASQEGTLMVLKSLGGYDGLVDKMVTTAELSLDSFQKVQVTKARQLRAETAAKTSVSTLSVAKEPTLQEQLISIQDIIEFLEKLWLEDSELQKEMDEKQWEEFMKAIYESLDVLKDQYDSKN